MRSTADLASLVLLAASVSALCTCGRPAGDEARVEDPAPAASAAPPAATGEALPGATDPGPTPPLPGTAEDVPGIQVWQCDDGGVLRLRNLPRDEAISIERHEGARKLALVPGGSGAKYSDGSLTFWSKGGTARFERPGAAAVECHLDRRQSLFADARARGVRYRGTGNEPGWFAEVAGDGRLLFVTAYGEERHEFAHSQASGSAQQAVWVYQAQAGEDRLCITVSREACADDMSGESFDHRMVVKYAGRTYPGCATALD
jgi:uncharacterized membrane protein